MLTQEGQEAARECLMRSGLVNPAENLANAEVYPDQGAHSTPDIDFTPPEKEVPSTSTGLSRRRKSTSTGLSRHRKSMDVPPESLERVYSNYFLNCYLYCEVKLLYTKKLSPHSIFLFPPLFGLNFIYIYIYENTVPNFSLKLLPSVSFDCQSLLSIWLRFYSL